MIMKCLKLSIILSIVISSIACSTMRIRKDAIDLSTITRNKTYQIKVRTGNLAMDKLIYELAYTKFITYLPISEKKPFTGFIEIVFTSASKGSAAGYSTNIIYGNAWYTGEDSLGSSIDNQPVGTEIAPGGVFSWQKSDMSLAIKDINGRKLWSADYSYKGGLDISRFSVNTADEAATYCLDIITEKFKTDFAAIVETSNVSRVSSHNYKKKIPKIALIVKSKKPSVPQETTSLEEATSGIKD
jgi:hypothetical protein